MTTSGAKLTIDDCAEVLRAVGADMALIGGQAVALWASEYQGQLNLDDRVMSKDVDFWGDREGVIRLAQYFKTRAQLPGMRDFTQLSGIVSVPIAGNIVAIDVLRKVPGVDEAAKNKAATPLFFKSGTVLVLDPISLIASKLHNVRFFDQSERNDLAHLKLCVRIAQFFIGDALARNIKLGLYYIKRLLKIAELPPNQPVLQRHDIKLVNAVPIEMIRTKLTDSNLAEDDRRRLDNFLSKRWIRIDNARAD